MTDPFTPVTVTTKSASRDPIVDLLLLVVALTALACAPAVVIAVWTWAL